MAKSSKNTKSSSAKGSTDDNYLVLARKYRPSNFDDLIGQSAMVETLRNAFANNRIAQAFMLSGVRGVGKTTTARILARALNYEKKGVTNPTIDLPDEGEHCASIMAGSHVDVLEMDAASHTGIDDIREIIEAARYKPMAARYKVYIIDEVHMLSKSAFNGLLKTLEEPPGHVKFIFATTELRKVPVTVLSRCQRFDLRRIDIKDLENHFAKIAKLESVKIDPKAISLVAKAAEGSVRDGLSLLDQAFASAEKKAITETDIRHMLGLADQSEIVKLLRTLLEGNASEALISFNSFYEKGNDPRQIIAELAETVHLITRSKALEGETDTADLPEAVRHEITEMAKALPMAVLSRAWQALLKGYDEIASAPNQVSAAEMVILRLVYMANLPTPDELISAIEKLPPDDQASKGNLNAEQAGGGSASKMQHAVNGPNIREIGEQAPQITPETVQNILPRIRSFADIINLISEKRDMKLKLQLEEYAELVRFAPGSIELHILEGADDGLAGKLSNKLTSWTGERWMVALSHERGKATIGSERRAKEQSELTKIKNHPVIEQVLQKFPGAEITDISPLDQSSEDND